MDSQFGANDPCSFQPVPVLSTTSDMKRVIVLLERHEPYFRSSRINNALNVRRATPVNYFDNAVCCEGTIVRLTSVSSMNTVRSSYSSVGVIFERRRRLDFGPATLSTFQPTSEKRADADKAKMQSRKKAWKSQRPRIESTSKKVDSSGPCAFVSPVAAMLP